MAVRNPGGDIFSAKGFEEMGDSIAVTLKTDADLSTGLQGKLIPGAFLERTGDSQTGSPCVDWGAARHRV